MSPTDLLIPIIALIVGVLSLFTDIKNPRGRKVAVVLIGLLIAACGFQIQNNYEKQKESERLAKVIERFEKNTGNSLEEMALHNYGMMGIVAEVLNLDYKPV
ncbi:MAG: hypothetical protein GDA56_32535 [Hormoscilla sp. GM7CHS1pb]|nr:hypothetical protein [Hormoscilla sp. GM7CHS1pb]